MKQKIFTRIISALLTLLLILSLLSLSACSSIELEEKENTDENTSQQVTEIERVEDDGLCAAPEYDVPGYTGDITYTVNGNIPYFQENEMYTESFEEYSLLDALGRCGQALACIGMDIMPTSERESISEVKPTGWHNHQYSGIGSGGWLYNRCHLIAFCLTGENANERNLITGTRAMNEAMIPFETQVAEHVEDTGHHVMYRVTPVFEGDNLVANGVLIEARCSEDSDCTFCVYCYNVQDGIDIDYATGENEAA